MKFKENAIKEGMVIHCPTEEDANALLEHLDRLGYKDYNAIMNPKINSSRYCRIADVRGYQWYCEVGKGITTTEFSNLIEPEMTAVEIVNWLAKNYYDGEIMTEVFNDDSCLDELGEKFGAQGIIDKITAYEAAKKASKPVETEWVDVCRIIKVNDNGTKKCVYEEDIPDDNGEDEYDIYMYDICEDILKKYASEHGGEYIAVMENVCRVKALEK